MFDLDRLAAAELVAHIDYHSSLGSTSDRALMLAAEGEAKLPLLVLTEQQTAGRGRGVHRWFSSPGALTFSLALEAPRDRLPPDRWPVVALVAGLATCEALESELLQPDTLASAAMSPELRLKWPNDILLGGRKLCGILSESVPGWRDRLVVGIGINVNNRVADEESASSQGSRPAISLIEHDRRQRDLTTVLLRILDQLDLRWQQLLAESSQPLLDAYRDRCFLSGKTVTMDQPGRRLVGSCRGIDASGRLILHTSEGMTAIASGTVVSWE